MEMRHECVCVCVRLEVLFCTKWHMFHLVQVVLFQKPFQHAARCTLTASALPESAGAVEASCMLRASGSRGPRRRKKRHARTKAEDNTDKHSGVPTGRKPLECKTILKACCAKESQLIQDRSFSKKASRTRTNLGLSAWSQLERSMC